MQIKQAIILAGGQGERLQQAVPGIPKCLAPVADRPFLFYMINALRMQGIEKFIFSLGYKHELIEKYLSDHFSRMQYECVIEDDPLGTGGAIRLAMEKASEPNILVANGDTLFRIDITQLEAVHQRTKADCTIALKEMQHTDRYGIAVLEKDNKISGFTEKKFQAEALMNGGIYILNKENYIAQTTAGQFSFENDYLPTATANGRVAGLVQDAYFIDIGIPADYERARQELKMPALDLEAVDKSWTLFLDRDGVINIDKVGSYIFNPDEFVFEKGSPEIFNKLTSRFGRIIVTTNQRGVERGLMTEKDLDLIHEKMHHGIEAAGGKIDAVYACTAIDNHHPDRKPNPGMITTAIRDFPAIDLSRAIMVGNNFTDMHFGKNAGIYTVFVKTTIPNVQPPHPDIDLVFESLADFAKAL